VILGPLKLLAKIVGALIGVIVLYFAITFVQVWLRGQEHSTKSADAILVFGTTEDNGRPSSELADRLSHALALYQAGRAPFMVVTGGRRPGDVYTEAGVSAAWMQSHGVPKSRIIVGGGTNTWQNVSSVTPAMRAQGIATVLTVTDPFHEYRAMAITADHGFTPYPSPVSTSAVRGAGLLGHYFKETIEVGVARFIGYSSLNNWLHA